MADIKLSVCLITYKQEQYIRQALDGIVTQKCNFPIEIVVSDDLSPDGTLGIIKEYAAKYPHFKILNNDKNIGMHRNWEKAIRACTGEYIALLEGDDFWKDELKLQKQVDILDRNKSLAISFTNANILDEVHNKDKDKYLDYPNEIYSITDLLEVNFIPTCSAVFRNHLFADFPAAYFRSPYADWIIHLLNAEKGNIHFLNEVTCTYRLNTGGVYGASKEHTRLERKVHTYNCICEILKGTPWYAQAKARKQDARYILKMYYRDKKEYISYIKASFL